MDEEEDIKWLADLDSDLWPPGHKNDVVSLNASRELTHAELKRVLSIIEEHRLVTEMISTSMFGGYGMRVYDNPHAPGVPLVLALTLIEGHLPGNTRWNFLGGTDKEAPQHVAGSGRDDAWELFSKYTHSDQNKQWLMMFKLESSEERYRYDY